MSKRAKKQGRNRTLADERRLQGKYILVGLGDWYERAKPSVIKADSLDIYYHHQLFSTRKEAENVLKHLYCPHGRINCVVCGNLYNNVLTEEDYKKISSLIEPLPQKPTRAQKKLIKSLPEIIEVTKTDSIEATSIEIIPEEYCLV